MLNNCPACNAPIADPTKQFCPSCEKLRLPDPSLKDLDYDRLALIIAGQLKRDWKFIAKIIGAVLAALLLIVGVVDYLRSWSSGTQSPGARSYRQNTHPLQVRYLRAAAPARDGEV
jgi:hypothetical protein